MKLLIELIEGQGEGRGDETGELDQLDSVVSVIELFKLPFPLKDREIWFGMESKRFKEDDKTKFLTSS